MNDIIKFKLGDSTHLLKKIERNLIIDKILIYIRKSIKKQRKFIKINLIILIFIIISLKIKSKEIKIALCAIGKKENLYISEFLEYYIKLGIDKIFIYDDNDINTEKIIDAINNIYKKYVKIYEKINILSF